MPKSKHRRKGKTRPRAAPLPTLSFADTPISELAGDAFDDDESDLTPEMAEALALAEEDLAEDLAAAAAGESGPWLDPDEDDDDEDFDSAIAPLLRAVEEQVRTNEPPVVAATLARLQSAGHERDEAISLIGAVLMLELNDVMQNDREFDPARYAARLEALPRLPEIE